MASGYSGPWVRKLFDRIASRYDLLNDLLSAGVHRHWKNRAVQETRVKPGSLVLDAATGTGDLALRLSRQGASVIGMDFSEGMLAIARSRTPAGGTGKPEWLHGDVQELPFPDDHFDGVTLAFGLRNFEDPLRGTRELWRVVKPGGRFVILEFGSWDALPAFSTLLRIASRILPADPEAYDHLIRSSRHFPAGTRFRQVFLEPLPNAAEIRSEALFLGVAHLYSVRKVS